MGKLLVKEKEIVVPGEVLAEGMDYLPSYGTYRKDDKIMANRLGLLSIDGKVLKTLQLAGRYNPRRNDVIIGKVFDILMSGWRIDINSAYSAVLMLQEASFKYIQKGSDLTKFFSLEDWVVSKITNVSSQNLVDVTMKGPGLRKLDGGKIIRVNTHKVPRIIGKQGSMVSMIKNATDCKITVGQNGVIWIQGEPEQEVIAVQTIKKIEAEAHHEGLTEEIKKFLESKGCKVEENNRNPREEREEGSENSGFENKKYQPPKRQQKSQDKENDLEGENDDL